MKELDRLRASLDRVPRVGSTCTVRQHDLRAALQLIDILRDNANQRDDVIRRLSLTERERTA